MAVPQTLTKQPSESRIYDMSFSANMIAAEAISSVTSIVATPAGLTLGPPTFSGTRLQVRISGGTTGVLYKLTAVVVTSLANILEGDGYLLVQNT